MSTINFLVGYDPTKLFATYDWWHSGSNSYVARDHYANLPEPTAQKQITVPGEITTELPQAAFSAGAPWGDVKKHHYIKMTNYSRSRATVQDHVAILPYELTKLILAVTNEGALSWPTNHYERLEWAQKRFSAQGLEKDLPEILAAPLDDDTEELYGSNSDYQVSLREKLREVKRIVAADSYQTWDALTSAAELSKALKLFTQLLKSAVNPIRTVQKLLSKSRDPREYADKWLQFRYGIMPTVYEIQDVIKLIEEKGHVFKTSRSSREDHFEHSTLKPEITTSRKYNIRTIDFRVSATGKARFGSSSLRALDQISINPFLTAWELVPFSFVVDWFVNIGDFIQAQSLSLSDHSEQRMFCYAIKSTTTTRRFYRRRYSSVPINSPTTFDGITYEYSNPLVDHSDQLLRTERIESYHRRIFYPSDAGLYWKPNLNWSRFLDSIAFATRSSTSAIRNLRI